MATKKAPNKVSGLRKQAEKDLAKRPKKEVKDGSIFPVLVNSRSVRNGKGEAKYRVIFTQDISELKEAQKRLGEQSKILEAFFASTITPLVLLDRDFNFIRVNEAYARGCQRDISEFEGRNHFELYPDEENEAIFRRVVETKAPYQAYAKPFTFPDHPEWGTTYWDWTLTPILDERGEVEYLVFALNDVTESTLAHNVMAEQAAILDLAHDGIMVRHVGGTITFWNRGAEQMYGWSKEEALGKKSDALLETSLPRSMDEIVMDLVSKGRWEGEITHTRRDGKKIVVSSRWALQRGDNKTSTSILEINTDITQEKEAEERINATNALLSLFSEKHARKEYLDGVIDLIQSWSGCRCVGIRVLDERGYIPYESYVGFSQEFWENENWISVHKNQCACIRVVTRNPDPQDLPMVTPRGSFCCGNTCKLLAQLSEEERARFRGVCIQNGFLSVSIIPICHRERIFGAIHLADERGDRLSLKEIEFIESMAPLIGEAINRFNLEEKIRESENRLRILSSQLLTVQEDERKRIARDVHDSLGASLAAVKYGMEATLQQLGRGTPKTGKIVKSLKDTVSRIQESIEEVRRIQMDLRPPILDDLGIIPTINWFTREFQKIYSHINIEREVNLQESDVSPLLRTVIYRVMQEALNNIAKHSKAEVVHLALKKEGDRIELTIKDDGDGFDYGEVVATKSTEKGIGLSSMRERAELSGGAFTVDSSIGAGTTIRASWALS